jgi:hypothetical protein
MIVVVDSMADHKGTVFMVKEKITLLVKEKLESQLKKFGGVSMMEDDYTFLVIHDEEVSEDDIKAEIENITV